MTARAPEMETLVPKKSLLTLSVAMSLASWLQSPLAARINTYAAPESRVPPASFVGAPTIARVPSVDTEVPKASVVVASLAVSLASWT
jgi:hypothetical protein